MKSYWLLVIATNVYVWISYAADYLPLKVGTLAAALVLFALACRALSKA